ncbi:Hypothetical protein FKW44_004650, partial [Caligus rogercresseyi]
KKGKLIKYLHVLNYPDIVLISDTRLKRNEDWSFLSQTYKAITSNAKVSNVGYPSRGVAILARP